MTDYLMQSIGRLGNRPATAYGTAVLLVAAAALVRFILGLFFPETVPFTTFFPAVLAAALIGGPGPGIAALALGAAVAWTVFLPPQFRFHSPAPSEVASLLLYAVSSGCEIAAAVALRHLIDRLAQSDERLRLAQEAGRIGHWEWDLKAGKSWWSDSLHRLLGEEPVNGPLDPERFFAFICPEDRPAMDSRVRAVLDGGQPPDADFRIVRRDGAVRWLSSRGTLMRDEAGRPQRLVGINIDITETKAAERRERFLNELHDALRPLDEPQAVMRAAAALLGHYAGAGRVGYSEIDTAGEHALITHDWVDPMAGMASIAGRHRLEDFGSAVIAALRRGETVAIGDVRSDPRSAASAAVYEAAGHRATLNVPLVKQGRLVAVLFLHRAVPHAWTDEEIAFAGIAAERTWAEVERARAETAGRAVSAQLRVAMSVAAMGTWEFDPETKEVVVSESVNAMFGVPNDGRRRTIDDYMKAVHSDDAEDLRAESVAAGSSGRGIAVEYRLLAPDGSVRWIAARGETVRCPDGRGRMAGALFDITRRKQAEIALRDSEARFRALAESTPQLVWSTLPDGYCDYLSSQWVDYTGIPETEHHGLGWQTAIHPDDRDGVAAVWAAAMRGEGRYDIEYRLRRHDGAYRWFKVRGRPLCDEATGRVLRWFGTCTDIQDIIEARQVLERANEALELRVAERTRALVEANDRLAAEMRERHHAEEALAQAQKMEAVGQLTGGVAHDFNNLLTGIVGNLELLDARLADETARRFVRNAMRSAERGAKLTRQLLAFSRRQQLQPTPVDLNAVVAGMGGLLRSTLGGTVHIETVPEADLWPALADPTQVELVILNLAINARDAMPVGGAITIETLNATLAQPERPEDPPAGGDYVAVRVTDTGTGMPPEVLARIFEPFFTTKEIGRGSGLGLPQVYGVARQLGGGVRVESRIGEGTAVTVYFPRARAAREGMQAAAPPAAVTVDGARILLVDDDADVRAAVAEMLRGMGCTVVEAESGFAALDRISAVVDGRDAAGPDLVLLDFAMPGMTGAETARRIRELRPDLPVLLMTGYADAASTLAETWPGLMLHKPFRVTELAERIGTALAGREKRRNGVVPLQPRSA